MTPRTSCQHRSAPRPAGCDRTRRRADLTFRVLDLLTDRRLADAHTRRGPGEVPFLRGREANHEAFAHDGLVVCSPEVNALIVPAAPPVGIAADGA